MRQRMGGLVVLLAVCYGLTGRAQVTTGAISGSISDTTGAIVPGVQVSLQNEETGVTRTVVTDAAGRYSAPLLGLGNYRITASMEGFQTEVRRGVVLTVGREAVVNLRLSVGAVSQTVEVTGEAPLVQTTESTVSYLVNGQTVRDLPLNGRDLTQLILLNPGVNVGVNGSTGNAYAGWAKKISISGAREESNAYLLDGTYINDMNHHIPSGPSGALLGVETVREFQVLTNSYGAQYGRSLGGIFNAVSKAGTNEWHGSIYEFLRNSALDARKWEDLKVFESDPRLPPFRRNQFGSTFGGPIAKDRAFFFLAYEGMRERLTTTEINNVPDENARKGDLPTGNVTVSDKIKPYLPYFPLPSPQGKNFRDGTAQYIFAAPQPTQDDFGQARVDYQLSANDSLFGRMTASNSSRSLVANYLDFHTIQLMGVRLFTLAETHIFSPHVLNTVHFAFNRVVPVDSGTYPSVPANLLSIPGQAPPGLNPGSNITGWEGFQKPPADRWTTNRFAYNDDVNLTLTNHSLQFGGMAERMQFNMDQPNRPYGTWGFSGLSAFLQGQPNNFRGTPPQFGTSIRGFRQWFFALYAQDDWKVTEKLTINLGLRWEPYTVAKEVNGRIANQRQLLDPTNTKGDPYWLNHSARDFGPRFGFAWSPKADGRTSVRGGFGIVFMPNDAPVYRTQTVRNPVFFPEFNYSIPATQPIVFPDGLAQIALIQQASFGATEAVAYTNLKSSKTLQYSLNVQQQMGASSVISVGYVGARGIHHTAFGNYDIPTAVFDGESLMVPVGASKPNPAFESISYYTTNANSWYNALGMSFQRRFSKGLQAQASYTFSRTISQTDQTAKVDYSGAGSGGTLYALDLRVGKGLSGFHVAHTLSANYSYDIPLGQNRTGLARRLLSDWQLTGIVSAQTGQPFSVSGGGTVTALSNLGFTRRPNVNASFPKDQIVKGGPDLYFDPQAFSLPGPRQIGNAGRNTLIGPGLVKWDMGVTKSAAVTERLRLQFRAEAFNMLNRPNFAIPFASIFTGTAGTRVGSAGTIDHTITSAREIQLSLKLMF
jgi:outer membrane receptor protein involved in Fe transport